MLRSLFGRLNPRIYMVSLGVGLSLAGYAVGAFGGVLIFIEFFQTPSYLTYQQELENWNLELSPRDVDEFTWAGRIGAICIALAFALLFVGTLVSNAGF